MPMPHSGLVCEALHSASPELHLTLYEFESASDCEWAMLNIAPHGKYMDGEEGPG